MNVTIKRALLSVSDKTGLVPFAKALAARGVEMISTGGTAKALTEAGIQVIPIDQITGFPEMMDGRVKTLHPAVHGGLLADRRKPAHMEALAGMGYKPIDLVCVNLYPFESTVAKPDVCIDDAVENIDIGGPSMVRSAAKNHHAVAVVTDPSDYEAIMAELDANDGALGLETRQKLCVKAYAHTSFYDAQIAAFLRTKYSPEEQFPGELTVPMRKATELRYGENPHQKAAFFRYPGFKESSVANAQTLEGKALSYNNYLDADAALEAVKEWAGEEPTCVIVKHTNPCGIAQRDSAVEAVKAARDADPISAFGGILALNVPVDADVANEITAPNTFLEVVIAPAFSDEAVKILTTKKKWGANLRLMVTGLICKPAEGFVVRGLTGGALVQERDLAQTSAEELKVVTERQPTADEIESLLFAWRCVKHVKSNAIAFVKDRVLVGAGAGQMNRVQSVRLAAEHSGELSKGAVLASDAFFPFPDNIETAAAAGITAVIQPGGSKKDGEVIAAADKLGLAMVFTGTRHFRH